MTAFCHYTKKVRKAQSLAATINMQSLKDQKIMEQT